MVDPISSEHLSPIGPARPAASPSPTESAGGEGDFASQLRQQLDQVSQMQAEADQGIQNLLTGRTDNITEVLTTARKAEIAFSLLMEIRNKLVDAYVELRQLRV
jgi:flagellar hook-basal body complex protein FliE